MPISYHELLHTPAIRDRVAARIPIGTRVRIGGAPERVDKLYRGMTGTIIEYGHPASVFDHLILLDQMEQTRWFRPSEFTVLPEEESNHADPVDH